MLTLPNGTRLVQHANELPNLEGAERLYLDVETTTFGSAKKEMGLSPYNCDTIDGKQVFARICGVAVTVDAAEGAWYIPVRHADSAWNVPEEAYKKWLKATVSSAKAWVNHNIKLDAHFCAADGAMFTGELHDTVVRAKLIDSDRGYGRGTYDLGSLSYDWLGEDIEQHERRLQPYLMVGRKKIFDYGRIPADILGEYAGQDVLTNRKLDLFECEKISERSKRVWDVETRLTPVLFDMEHEGMHVDPLELRKAQLATMAESLMIAERLKDRCGWTINPSSNDDCYQLLCSRHGLPVLGRTKPKRKTDLGNPSFDKKILALYLDYPDVVADKALRQTVKELLEYRKRSTLLGLFIEKFQEFNIDGVLHSDYNQCVRTGRMSCKRPNQQQNSKRSKALIHPADGEALLSYDYSQIEFRIIGHYIGNERVITAYRDNPDTDFHQWVADESTMNRKPAKSLNFGMGFGMGKKKLVGMLATNAEVVGKIYEELDRQVASGELDPSLRQDVANKLCKNRGEELYGLYHRTLPELKPTSDEAARNCRIRGFVFNGAGRERRLPRDFAHKAFNNVVQSYASDIAKERACAIAPRYCSWMRELGLKLIAMVHDEFVFSGPIEVTQDPTVRAQITQVLEATPYSLSVPLRVECGWSQQSWAEASGDEGAVEVDRSRVMPLGLIG